MNKIITPEEYLKMEEKSHIKHEYIDGELCAKTGASDTHVTIALNLATALRNHVRGSNCRVYISDMTAKIESRNRFYYPDIMVTCDEKDRTTPNFKQFPYLIIEVLSDSTEAFDRGDRFADYQELASLQEYVLINTKKQRIECFRRSDFQKWILEFYTEDKNSFELKSIDFKGKLETIYEDVNFESV